MSVIKKEIKITVVLCLIFSILYSVGVVIRGNQFCHPTYWMFLVEELFKPLARSNLTVFIAYFVFKGIDYILGGIYDFLKKRLPISILPNDKMEKFFKKIFDFQPTSKRKVNNIVGKISPVLVLLFLLVVMIAIIFGVPYIGYIMSCQ